jgi:hypothetical protein
LDRCPRRSIAWYRYSFKCGNLLWCGGGI